MFHYYYVIILIGYIEIPTDDIEETKKFYSNMFGWKFEKGEGEK
jgi:predicted enzyme related to lactoylglutathione lyase